MAGTDIAIDLGSANFRLYVDGKGVVVDEPNVIAVDEDSNRVVAVGRRAYKMLGRTSDRVRVVKPVTGGVYKPVHIFCHFFRGLYYILDFLCC